MSETGIGTWPVDRRWTVIPCIRKLFLLVREFRVPARPNLPLIREVTGSQTSLPHHPKVCGKDKELNFFLGF